MKKGKALTYPVIICFMLFIISVLAASLSTKPVLYNEKEGKALAQCPTLFDYDSFDEFADAWDSFVSDQFPGRNAIVSAKQNAELSSGENVIIGDLFVLEDNYVFCNTPVFDEADVHTLAELIQKKQSELDIPIYYAVVPQKNLALGEDQEYINEGVDKGNLDLLISQFTESDIDYIDCCQYMLSFPVEERSTFYFKTDYHWNMLGAYNASEFLIKSLAGKHIIEKASIPQESDFVWEDFTGTPYKGDLANRLPEGTTVEEYIPVYTAVNADDFKYYTDFTDEAVPRDEIVFRGRNDEILNYNTMSTDNNPYLRIENPFAPENKHVLILRDSYQCCMTDYLSEVFTEINLLEPRAVACPTLAEVISERDIDMIICIYHNSNYSKELVNFLSAQ